MTTGYMRGSVATLSYEDKIETTGWGQIRLHTSGDFSDQVQAMGAGYIVFFVGLSC